MKYYILTLISALMLSSCSLINERDVDCPHPTNGDENIILSFSMMSPDALLGTRADDQGHIEVGSELLSFEDGIDMKDCAVFIFAKMDGSNKEEALLYKIPDFGSSQDVENSIYGTPGLYTVNMVIAKNRLNDLLDFELNPDREEKIQFRILVLANCSSPGTNAMAKWDEIDGTSYSEVIRQLNDWKYAMGYIYNEAYTGDDAAGIYANRKKNAPMFGTILAFATQEALYYSRTDDRVYLGEMELLRAIAKIRVIDNIRNKDADGYPKITGAEFIGSQSMARQLPSDAINYQNGNQIHIPNIAEPDKELTLNGATTYRLGTIPDAWFVTPPDQRTGQTWIGYAPEQKIGNINNDIAQGMPVLSIRVAVERNADGSEKTVTYDVPMTGYKGNQFDFGDYILRNHIYTLSVDEVAVGADAELTFNVAPWVESSFDLDYTQTVSVSKALDWKSGYEEIDDSGYVVIKPWTSDPETGVPTWVPLTGQFALESPVGATWSAHLITEEGAPNAFAFYKNGEIHTSVSGTIDGKALSDIIIVSLNDEPTEVNSAKLQVVVTIGTAVIEAPLTSSTKFKNYTIIQNPL